MIFSAKKLRSNRQKLYWEAIKFYHKTWDLSLLHKNNFTVKEVSWYETKWTLQVILINIIMVGFVYYISTKYLMRTH